MSDTVIRSLQCIFIGLFLNTACLAQDVAGAPVLKIGVREDAVSMSYRLPSIEPFQVHTIPGPLRKRGYTGYMVYICDRVLVEMQRKLGRSFIVETVSVQAHERFEKLNSGKVHILCDPTTATKHRLDGLISSPPLFITGTSYATRPPVLSGNTCGSIVGVVGSTTSEHKGLNTLLSNGELRRYSSVLKAYMREQSEYTGKITECSTGQGTENTVRDDPILYMKTHTDVVEAFCKDEIKVYVGDLEILTQNLKLMNNCRYTGGLKSFGDDRYVVLGKIPSEPSMNSDAFLIGQFFGILSQMIFFKPSLLDEAFDRTFSGAKRSNKLQYLYWGLRG